MPALSQTVDKGVDVPRSALREPTMANSLDKSQGWASGVCKICEETRARKQSEGVDVE